MTEEKILAFVSWLSVVIPAIIFMIWGLPILHLYAIYLTYTTIAINTISLLINALK